jgi:TolB-like protein/DNA-binding winged helix-turn-helix (wHTH) protein/Flp pilus assembly protein TadD
MAPVSSNWNSPLIKGSGEMRPVKSLEHSVIQIGAWRVDPALDEISRDGQTTKLEPKMMQLLLCLAAHAGQVVSVEQLLEEVWKDVVVTPDSVYHAVATLRRVLGDNSKDPAYIANVMRRGYRLIAPVVPLDAAATPAPPLQPPHSDAESQAAKPTLEVPPRRSIRKLTGRRLAITTVTVVAMACAYFIVDRVWIPKRFTATQSAASAAKHTAQSATAASAVAFAPPPYSIAVLPFVNISGNKQQEYFSDGLTEELLDSLTRISELRVAARASSFSFQGQHPDITTVAHKLNVGAVLEGSVRRAGNTVRITAQLVDGTTGFHLWSHSYDRDLGDVLALQTEIASAVTSALKVTLLGAVAAKVELGGTRKPAALDAYLKGSQAFRTYSEGKDLETAVAAYTDAIQLDPDYALAYVARSRALDELASWWVDDKEALEVSAKARADARRALALAPNLGEAHLVLGNSLFGQLDFTGASVEYERALALAPGNALVLRDYGLFSVLMGRTEQGLSASRRAVLLDPLNRAAHLALMDALINARRPEEAVSAVHDALTLGRTYSPDQWVRVDQWVPYYVVGDYESARAMCENNRQNSESHACLAVVYHKLGRHTDAKVELEKFETENPDDSVQAAQTYAQWGDTAKALSSLEKALRTRYGALVYLKTWPLLDPLRKEPRFQAIERELKFPD